MKRVSALVLVCLISLAVCAGNKDWKRMKQVLAEIKQPTFADRSYSIIDYQQQGDTLFTKAINRAIEVCSQAGGGKVVVPAGTFYTGPIRMKSNVNLHLSEGAVLKFITDVAQFPIVLTRIEGIDCYNLSPLIYAYGEENIAVTGKGILDGQASHDNWFNAARVRNITLPDGSIGNEKELLNRALDNDLPMEQRVFQGKYGMRPQFINFYKCKNILLEDIELNHSPFWLIHPLLSENVILRRVKMNSHGGNNDGCDPESCKNVLIEDCYFDTGDDCIAIKSGKNGDGRKWNIPSENLIVRNCLMKDGHAGVAIGSEMTGGCRNVWVENCKMDSPHLQRIIRIKSNPLRGGVVENVYVRNIEVGVCDLAILGIELRYWRTEKGDYLPLFRNIHIDRVNSQKSRFAVHVDGLPGYQQAQDIYLSNCDIQGVTDDRLNVLEGAKNVQFKNVKINGKKFVLK